MSTDEKERHRQLLARIREGMEVVDTDGTRIGTVARIEGGHLKILRNDRTRATRINSSVRSSSIRSTSACTSAEAGTNCVASGPTTSSTSTTICGRTYERRA